MTRAPVSSDLLIKLALTAAALGAVWYAYRQARAGLDNLGNFGQDAATWAGEQAQFLNPASPKNVIYSGVNAVGASVTGDSSFSLGSWIYDVLHPEPLPPTPRNTGGATGSW